MSDSSTNLNRKRKLRNILLTFVVTIIFVAILFISAGSLAWSWGWVLAGIMIVGNVVGVLLLDPRLLEERIGIKSGSKREDILLSSIMGRLGPLAIIIIAGLDFRFSWSGPFPPALAVLGIISYTLGVALALWSMRENRFFSSVVRIQIERGHHVVTTGPYQLVRHPGYLGSVVSILALSLALTSYWSLIPAVITDIISFVRTVLEDNTLKRELEGYSQYAERVRHRLVPGIW